MISLLLMFFSLNANQGDPAADLTHALQQLNKFKVHFTQKTQSDFFDETLAEGTLWVQRPGKMRMEYLVGERRLLIWDGKNCYESDFAARTEEHLDQAEVAQDPLVQILLYGADLRGPFVIQRSKAGESTQFRLLPRDGSDYLVNLTIGPNRMPALIEVLHEDGEEMRLWFDRFELAPNFPADAFRIPERRTVQGLQGSPN